MPTAAQPFFRSKTKLLAALLLAGLVAVAYAPVIQCEFIWDDDAYVTENETLRSGSGLWNIWTDRGATPQYYPLVHTTFWIEYRLWGEDPLGYHIVNVLLHLGAALLLWRALDRLGVSYGWWIAAVFALHPIQVESVAWVTERKNVLAGLFYVASLVFYLRHLGFRGESRWRDYAIAFALFVCALLSKSVTLTLPVVILLILWWKRVRPTPARLLPLAPMLLVGLVVGLMTARQEVEDVLAVGRDFDLSLVERTLVAGRALWFYAGKLLWPSPLIFNYPRWEIDAGDAVQYLFPIAFAVTAAVLWFGRERFGRGPLVACAFYVVTLSPALGFFNVFPMKYSFVADHFQYLAGIGVVALFVGLLAWIPLSSPAAFKAIGAAIVLALVLLTWNQIPAYRNLEALWTDTLEKNPDSWFAYNNLGAVLFNRNEPAEAIPLLEKAVALREDFHEAHYNLGNAYLATGRRDEAVQQYERSIAIAPDFAGPRLNLANVYAMRGQFDRAMEHYTKLRELEPNNPEATYNMGLAFLVQRKLDEARSSFDKTLEIDPGHERARGKLRELGR